jgi:hypothetical protein
VAFPTDTKTLVVVAKDSSGVVVGSPTITYASSNPAVATVDAAGKVTAVGAGTAKITASSNGTSLDFDLTVAATPTDVAGLLVAYPFVKTSTIVPGMEVRCDVSDAFAQERLTALEQGWSYMTTYFGGAPTTPLNFYYTADSELQAKHVRRIQFPGVTAEMQEIEYTSTVNAGTDQDAWFLTAAPLTPVSYSKEKLLHEMGERFFLSASATGKTWAAWLYEGLGLYFDSGTIDATGFTFTKPRQFLIDLFRERAKVPATYVTLPTLFQRTYDELSSLNDTGYPGAAMLVSYLMTFNSGNMVKTLLADIRSGTVPANAASLEAALLARTSLPSVAALEAAYVAWVDTL